MKTLVLGLSVLGLLASVDSRAETSPIVGSWMAPCWSWSDGPSIRPEVSIRESGTFTITFREFYGENCVGRETSLNSVGGNYAVKSTNGDVVSLDLTDVTTSPTSTETRIENMTVDVAVKSADHLSVLITSSKATDLRTGVQETQGPEGMTTPLELDRVKLN